MPRFTEIEKEHYLGTLRGGMLRTASADEVDLFDGSTPHPHERRYADVESETLVPWDNRSSITSQTITS